MTSSGETEAELLDYDEEQDGDKKMKDLTVQTSKKKPPAFAGHIGTKSTSFKDFLLKPELLQAIADAGFEHPSEVQQQCIPQANVGTDILCQAKSGMGKTAVYVISSLQTLDVNQEKPAVVVLAPTRELAYQIAQEFIRFKKYLKGARLALFVGGYPLQSDIEKIKDRKINIVVGTPGRMKALVQEKALDLSETKVFVIDECDKMLAPAEMRAEVQETFMATPQSKQVILVSATLPKDVLPICRRFLHTNHAHEIIVDNETTLSLEKLHQHYVKADESRKLIELNSLLDILQFNQVIVFVNTVARCGKLNEEMLAQNFPTIEINSAMDQVERLARYHQFKNFEKRILIATDLFGRGMDIERVNVVINYDCPRDSNTYLHRIARAGRFGAKGLAVTFLSNDHDSSTLNEVQDRFNISITSLPDEIDPSLYSETSSDITAEVF
ncbi:hypothetical protein RvY_13840 [Ramazzottius varieornatus]|uniref:RNA helicase n=1 Tax=Ramazzottius varieornatus TaxID=947166 RepID=A0A1D1VT85_RAMVA|nr:hypothetical protein RvY_13840 [Ramazzottius varieornatus]